MLTNLEDGVGKQHSRLVIVMREVEEREGDACAQAAIGARWDIGVGGWNRTHKWKGAFA